MGTQLVIVVALLGAACSKKAPPTPTTWQADTAREAFAADCSTCHGLDGTGHGSAGALLDPKPRNYTDKVWQRSITDEQIGKTIVLGGTAVGKSKGMPPHPQYAKQPEVLAELVKIVRAFGQ